MDSLIETFHIDWHMIIAQAINFAIVFFVLYRFAIKPLKRLMEERSATIAGGLDNAKKQEELLRHQKEQYDLTLSQARSEASIIMKDVKKEAEEKRAELLVKAQAEVATLIANGKKQLDSEKVKMLEDAKKEMVSLVVSATQKIIGNAMNDTISNTLVEESIKNI